MLGTLITKYLGGRAAKAVMAGGTGLISALIGPEVLSMVQGGFVEGVGPAAHQFGVVLGSIVGGGLIALLNYLPTYWKANKPE